MTENEALTFLKSNQPMPDDESITQELIERYDAVRLFFKDNPCKESIALFFGSFGTGDGLGVYQLIEDTITAHDDDDVICELNKVLKNGRDASKYWCAQIASNYSDTHLLIGLEEAIESSNTDVKEAAIIALESIGGKDVMFILKRSLQTEHDEQIRKLIQDVIENM